MKKTDKFESISMSETDLAAIKGGDFSLNFTHWHKNGGYTDENGVDWTIQQKATWWGFLDRSKTRKMTD